MRIIWEKESSEAYRKKIKENMIGNIKRRTKLSKTGNRVLVRVLSEKENSRFPKPTNVWNGPYRIEVTENSAKVVKLEDVIRNPFDQFDESIADQFNSFLFM